MVLRTSNLLKYLFLFLTSWSTINVEGISISVFTNDTTTYLFEGGSPRTIELNVTSVPPDTQFVLLHAHSQWHDLQLSVESGLGANDTAVNPDTGLVLMQPLNTTISLTLLSNQSSYVLIGATAYSFSAPIPGGCNTDFHPDIAPFMKKSYDWWQTTLMYQRADAAIPSNGSLLDCRSKLTKDRFAYKLYVYYMLEQDQGHKEYIKSMKNFMTVDSVENNGQLVRDFGNVVPENLTSHVTSWGGQGAIYALVVYDKKTEGKALYVPSACYACNALEQDCKSSLSLQLWIYSFTSCIVGVTLCFFGHRFFKTGLFFYGLSSVSIVFYIILSYFTALSYAGVVATAVVLGMVGGVLWVGFWWRFSLPVISIILPAALVGFVFSSIIYFTPFGNLSFLDDRVTYCLTFSCGVLLVPVVLVAFTKKCSIICSSVLGSYLVVTCVDQFFFSHVTSIVTTSMIRFTHEGLVFVAAPIQVKDIILYLVWAVLALGGISIQWTSTRGQPPFPASPYSHWRQARLLEQTLNTERSGLINSMSDERQIYASTAVVPAT